MAGHDLLPGCRTPWKHDCPGSLPSPDVDRIQFRTGGVVCHCPCHPLLHAIAVLTAEVERLGKYERAAVDTVSGEQRG